MPLCGKEFSIFSLIFRDHWSIISGSVMPLARIRQMIEIGETEANPEEKELSALLKFQISSENFDPGCGHYNQQYRFVVKVSRYKEEIPMFHLYN